MLHSRLKQIAASLDEQIDPAIRRIAEDIADGAKNRVPVDTGALRNAIHVEKVGEGSYAVVAGDHDAYYGHIVEGGGAHTPPRPFLMPAYEAERPRVDELVRAALRDI